ncbi:MAG: hypothetical protein GX102_06800 [Porphyromonadaceae bacterium]|nr:hypothetical protein [Porphyromonadaceae bacterium]
MNKSLLFILIFLPIWTFSQNSIHWTEDFSDRDFTQNPVWSGMTDNFIVNSSNQLQSNASTTSRSYLSTPSEVFEDATWEFWVRINYTTSSNNYAMVYIISDRADISGDLNGYYVHIGNTADEISLYRQQGNNRTKIIDGADKSIDTNPVIVTIRVTRSKDGTFSLFRKRQSENPDFNDADFVQENAVAVDNHVQGSKYFGVLFANTGTTGNAYFFDNISVSGDKFIDEIPPEWTDLQIVEPNQLILTFSEEVDLSTSDFQVDNGIGNPTSVQLSQGNTMATLTFSQNFARSVIYTVQANNVKDLAGNLLQETEKQIGIYEKPEIGDLVINEILFDNLENSDEYFEIYNNSAKAIDLSNVFFGVRNTAGNFNLNNFFPANSIVLPHSYLALTRQPDLVREAYKAPNEANIIFSERWNALNNTGANFLIGSYIEGDTLILDEVGYSAKWHHSLIRNVKGVSLERIHPELNSQDPSSWHSAASEVNYGTPGYKNSQFREIAAETPKNTENWFYPDPEAFTPDNDSRDDVLFIRYKTDAVGFTANVIIFNAVGAKITQIATNQLLGSDGFMIWDGKTDRGLNVNPGIYVLYVELVNSSSGQKKVEKMPVVVSAR